MPYPTHFCYKQNLSGKAFSIVCDCTSDGDASMIGDKVKDKSSEEYMLLFQERAELLSNESTTYGKKHKQPYS